MMPIRSWGDSEREGCEDLARIILPLYWVFSLIRSVIHLDSAR